MNCPSEITSLLLDILHLGLLRCRAAAWADDSKTAAREADHVHNLPALLADFKIELLLFCWDTERTSFMRASGLEKTNNFADAWNDLETEIDKRYRQPARNAS